MRIIIVEDEIKTRRGMANLITRHTEHTIVGEAKNGQEGLEMIQRFRPDLVITDIRMPVMGGLEMIKTLYEQGISQHCVILSGYSEFDYAKQAIRYGVDDYLIKPLAPEDVTTLLESIQKKILKELHRQQGTPEKKLRDILMENEEVNEDELRILCGFKKESTYRLLSAYIGTAGQKERKICLERFEKIKIKYPQQKFIYFFLESRGEFICVMEDDNWKCIRDELHVKLIRNKLVVQGWVWTENACLNLPLIKRQYQKAREQYVYGMVLGNDSFINQEKINSFMPCEFQYPKNTEHEMQIAVYSEKKDKIDIAGQKFIRAMADMGVKPTQIKEGYMKMANFLMTVSQENNLKVYEQLQSLNIIRSIGTAKTIGELEAILKEEIRVISLGMNHREDISNYTIKRAIDYIRNHYQESISLEAVAGRLDITPEYLSTLFNREVGENFSIFLKKFRISHAKRMLKGTDKKIYEIAQAVGYADPKYFNRVFKEEEGISPGDFRALR